MAKLTELDWQIVTELADNNMNITEVGRVVFMHRNTVVYHLWKIKKVTGLDPMNFYDLIKLVQIAKGGKAVDESNP